MTMSIKTANFRLKLQMKTFIYTFNAFNLHLSFPCNSILKFWMYTSWLLSWLIRGEMDNFNQVGATKFCFVAKVFPSKLIFFSSRMLWTLWRPWVWTPGSRRWSTWPTRSASTASSTTRTSASSSSGSTARRTGRPSTRPSSRLVPEIIHVTFLCQNLLLCWRYLLIVLIYTHLSCWCWLVWSWNWEQLGGCRPLDISILCLVLWTIKLRCVP